MSSEIEKNVEEKFRSRFTLLDKQDAAAIAQAQQAGVPVIFLFPQYYHFSPMIRQPKKINVI